MFLEIHKICPFYDVLFKIPPLIMILWGKELPKKQPWTRLQVFFFGFDNGAHNIIIPPQLRGQKKSRN